MKKKSERPERIRRQRKSEAMVAEFLTIGRRCAGTLKGRPVDHGAMLYDERGLPR